MAQTAHYKLTPTRITAIVTAVEKLLRRRVFNAMAVCPLTGEMMEKLHYTDEQLAKLRAAAEFYAHNMSQTCFGNIRAVFDTPQGPIAAAFQACSLSSHYAPSVGSWSNYPSKIRDVSIYRKALPHHAISLFVVLDEDHYECEERRQIVRELREWGAGALTAMRRFDLGIEVLSEVLYRCKTLTNIAATIPFIRPALIENKHDEMVRELDRAPKRTLAQYRVTGVEAVRIEALKHLVTEGVVLPSDPSPSLVVHNMVYEKGAA